MIGLMAMRIPSDFDVFGGGLGAANDGNENFVLSQELSKTKKRKPFKLCWLKESY
jgi:hypothetical protein